jgi:long-subunit acyl-CoA synthetase (AMP-forming)
MAEIVDLAARRPHVDVDVAQIWEDLMRQIRQQPDTRAAARAAFIEFARVLVEHDVTPDELINWALKTTRHMRELLDDVPDGAA